MSFRIVEADNKDSWENFVANRSEANFLQSWQWGQFHLSLGKKIFRRIVIDEHDKWHGVYEAVVETAKRGTYMTVAGGPLIDWHNQQIAKLITDDLKSLAKSNGCVFVRVRPQLELSPINLKIFNQLGYRPAPMPLSVEHAGIIDLSDSDEQIMANMSQSLRRKIRKSQKLKLDLSTSTSLEDLETFYEIHHQHAKRLGYVPFSKQFLQEQFKAFNADDQILIYNARHQNKIIAQNFVIFYGAEASYHYGVSTAEGVKLSSAPLLHLLAIKEARKRGCQRYNFWGIVDEDDTKHRYYGVSQFKRSFGVKDLKHIPAQDLVIRKLPYRANWLFETTRRKQRRL